MTFFKDIGQCCQCGEPMAMTEATHQTLKRSGAIFYCTFGHQQVFATGPTEADKLRREHDRLKQENARLEEYRLAAERAEQAALEHAAAQARRAAAARGQVTRLKNRAAAGVCPCCNRTFVNLQRHMASKHAGFVAEEVQGEAGAVVH